MSALPLADGLFQNDVILVEAGSSRNPDESETQKSFPKVIYQDPIHHCNHQLVESKAQLHHEQHFQHEELGNHEDLLYLLNCNKKVSLLYNTN